MTTTLTTDKASIKAELVELNSEHESLLNDLEIIDEAWLNWSDYKLETSGLIESEINLTKRLRKRLPEIEKHKEELLSQLQELEQEEKERDRIAKNTQKLEATREDRQRLEQLISEHDELATKLREVLSEIRALDGKCSLSLIKPNGCRVSCYSVGLHGIPYNERFQALKPISYIEIDPKNL